MIVFIFIVFLLLCYFGKIYYKHVYVSNKLLVRFPCPPGVPILGNVLDFIDKGSLDVLNGYLKNYGDTVRIKTGPFHQILVTSNSDFFRFILTSSTILKKAMEYKCFHAWLGMGLVTSDGSTWKKHRQIITPTFHYEILEDFVDIFESNGKILVRQFEKYLDSSSVEIYNLVNLCTLDIICESAMGTPVNAQKNSKSEYVRSVKDMLDIIIERVFSSYKMIDWLYIFTEAYRKEKRALKVIHSYSWNVIKKRQESLRLQKNKSKPEDKKRKPFLDLLLEASYEGTRLTLEEIREEVDTFMFAGHDTTGTALCFILFCLANHPEEQAKVLLEQKQIFGDDFDRSVTLQDLKNMKYLENVIKEALRLYPPSPFYSRKLDSDVEFDGTILPKGLTICLFAFALHRNPNYFAEPEKFSPGRFENNHDKIPFTFLPFSAGPRNCIGQRFAMTEMKSVASRIVRSFELLPAVPVHELHLASQTILLSSNGVRIRFRKRT